MQVTVEGVITSIEEKVKEDKLHTEVLLAQKGETQQVRVRLQGHKGSQFSEFEVAAFSGRLMQWKTRDGMGSMVMVGGY